jgi:hypothetical protein
MRVWIALIVLIAASPAYAQMSMGSTSGAQSMVDINSPANTTAHVITTPTVAAPGLAAAGVETCLGSASGGLSLMGGGITFGTTKVDTGCTIRLLARQLFAFGLHKAAIALMCQDDRVAAAMAVAGSPCPPLPGQAGEHVAAITVPPSPEQAPEAAEPIQDPVSIAKPAPLAALVPQSGYILDLKRSPIKGPLDLTHAKNDEPTNAPVQVALAPPQPFTPQEQAWFDRASDIN